MGLLGRLAMTFGLAAGPAFANDTIPWPDLPTKGFTSGRVASVEDAKRGDATFSMDGQSRGALPIPIPQYVIWTDEHGVKHPMILVQAEEAPDGSKIVGLRDFKGQEAVAILPEVTLLGTKKPS